MRKLNFTKTALENLPYLSSQYEVADTKVHGLRLRINPGQSKTFILLKKINNSSRRIKISRLGDLSIEEVRIRAIKLLGKISDGTDPQIEKEKKRAEITFTEMFNTYYKQHSLVYNKNPIHNKNIVNYHVTPAIGNRKISTITNEMIRNLHLKIGDTSGRVQANRVITIVSATYNFYIKNGYWKGTNPCQGIRKFPTKSRDRFLSLYELDLFKKALAEEDQLFQDYFKLALFTGVRKNNLLSMKYADLDFVLKRWRIPETQTKNGEVNIVLLSNHSLEILSRRKTENDREGIKSPYVFPSDSKSGHLTDPKRSFERIKQRMGVSDIRIHDLRRTLGSYMAISGASLPVIGKALNHKNLNSTAIYARLSNDPIMDAVTTAVNLMEREEI